MAESAANSEYVQKQMGELKVIQDNLDTLYALPRDMYELRNAFEMTGNTAMAERMDEFASTISNAVREIQAAQIRHTGNYIGLEIKSQNEFLKTLAISGKKKKEIS
jgi:hypothetical protein